MYAWGFNRVVIGNMRRIPNGRDLRLPRSRPMLASHLRKVQIEVKLDGEKPALLSNHHSGPGDEIPWRLSIQTRGTFVHDRQLDEVQLPCHGYNTAWQLSLTCVRDLRIVINMGELIPSCLSKTVFQLELGLPQYTTFSTADRVTVHIQGI